MATDDARRVRNTAIALGVAVGLLFWGVIARVWFAGLNGNAGLVGVEMCAPLCMLKLWPDLEAPLEITVLGFAGFLFGLKSVALGAHAFAMVLKREPVRIKRNWLLGCTIVTVVACAAYLVRMLGEPFALSYPGFFAIFGGIALLVLVYRIEP
jgi:hypothetical protein